MIDLFCLIRGLKPARKGSEVEVTLKEGDDADKYYHQIAGQVEFDAF